MMQDQNAVPNLYKKEMKIRRRKCLSILSFGLFVVSTFTLFNYFHNLDTSKVQSSWKSSLPDAFVLENSEPDKRVQLKDLQGPGKVNKDTTCHFPRLSLYNDANKDKFTKLDPLVCSVGYDLFYLDNGIVKMNNSVLTKEDGVRKNEIKKCDYLAVERISDNFFTYTEPVIKTKPPFDIIIHHDFIQVKCNIIDPDEEEPNESTDLNNGTDMTDQGKTEQELPEVRKHVEDSGYVDKYPMLWKDFEDHGYATLYAEDEPSINSFNLRLNGFQSQPTDHYMRPFWLALWQSTVREISPRYCTGHTPHHQFLLGYVKDYFLKYKTIPKFAFLFMCELTHWVNDPGQYLDSDFVQFLEWLKDSGELEKTVVVVMADHGGRYGKVRNSVQGKIEERMPMMSIRYPIKLIKDNPKLLMNLKLNKNRLVTAFDMHETILDILDRSRFVNHSITVSHRISLSQEIPFDRTCKDAHIDVHWCSCLQRIAQSTDNKYVKQSAEAVVSYINTLTLPVRKLCVEMELVQIKSAYLLIPNEKVLKFLKERDRDFRYANFSKEALLDIAHYEVTVETSPNKGLFEATVVANFKEGSFKLNPEISRIDSYGDQPACVQNQFPDLRKFCLCKTFLLKSGR